MRRLPALGFAAMAAATIFAFFLTQILKVETPVVWNDPAPLPAAFNPVNGHTCPAKYGNLDYRHTTLTIGLPKAGVVAVSVVNNVGDQVAIVSSGRSLPATKPGHPVKRGVFVWNGRETDGQIAPDGRYFFHISLPQQGRTITPTTPIMIMTQAPHPKVISVSLASAKATKNAGPVVLTPLQGKVTVHFAPADYRRVWIDVYRTDVAGRPQLVNQFAANPLGDSAVWNGDASDNNPVPAGTYLIGMTAQDMACNQATYPVALPPSPGTTPNTGVDVRYISATAPLVPTPAGTRAAVEIDSPTGPYTWKLRLAGRGKVLRQGSGVNGSSTLRVWLPAHSAALYTLTLTAGTYATSVPLVASGTQPRATAAHVLVVLPMLTWQGENRVDDSGDGLPSTLTAGDPIPLDRPFVNGLPAGIRQDAALLNYLNSQHLRFQLTTDVALSEVVGPSLANHSGVVLAGSETWLPASLLTDLKGWVQGGSRLLSIGIGALRGSSKISGYPANPVAAAPSLTSHDLFGATHGPLVSTGSDLITELTDQLGILAAVPVFSGFHAFQPIQPPTGAQTSLAGIADGAPAVTAFTSGRGYVVEVGLAGFNTSLAANVDAQELVNRVWTLLAK